MNPKQATEPEDDMEAEYDFASMKGGVRGKYSKEFQGTATAVLLDSDVAEVFPDSEAVNQALRTIARVLGNRSNGAQS